MQLLLSLGRLISLLLFLFMLICRPATANVVTLTENTEQASGTRLGNVSRWIAFGDIHADPQALTEVLVKTGITDKELRWIAGDAVVISMGDLLDRGPDSRLVMDILMRLEREAKLHGGRLFTLKGNHELLVTQGNAPFISAEDLRNYKNFARPGDSDSEIVAKAFGGHSRYARWIANRPTAVVVNETLFIHAGLESWAKHGSLEEINSGVREWFLYYQGNRGGPPPEETKWMVDFQGPLWTRKLAQGDVTSSQLSLWLNQLHVGRIVLGHTVTESRTPEVIPKYEGKVVLTDTGMLGSYGGSRSAIEWNFGKFLSDGDLKIHVFSRGPHKMPACHEIFSREVRR